MRALPTPLLTFFTSFFADPTFWNDFSPARFEPAVRPFLLAIAITVLTVLPARWLAFRIGAVALPGERHSHTRPTARLGGLAMYMGFGMAAAIFSSESRTLGLLLCAAAITALMVFDDMHEMPPLLKLACQVAVSLLAIRVFGITIDYVGLPHIGFLGLPGTVIHLGWLITPITLVWFVALQNTVNLLDGVDGLATGVVGIVAAAILLAAINLGRPDIVVLAGALIGCCLGFLLFNWHPARIFMGDAGSHFLGFTLAALSALALAKGTVALALAVPVLALLIPIVDTGWAILRRWRGGRSITKADTEHLHHRLLDYGLSPREAVLTFYFGTAIFAALGLAIYGHKRVLAGAIALLLLGILIIVVRRFRRIRRH